MYYGEIKFNDISNGPGVRTSLFVSGCTHHCENCFNKETWDFKFGKEFTKETEDKIIESLKPPYVQGFTLLGGEPMEHINQQGVLPLLERIKRELPEKNIWIFSGYMFDKDILEVMAKKWPETMKILELTDVLVDGEFVEALKDITLKFKGSSNQRTIDVQKSLKEKCVVTLPGY